MADILRTAAEMYASGVVDCVIGNMHEFQGARGFTRVIGRRQERIAPADEVERRALERMKACMSSLRGLWSSLAPE